MRGQINNGKLNDYSQNTLIAIGTCSGENTFEIVCEIPDNFNDEFWNYEAIIENEQIAGLVKINIIE